MGAVIGGCVTVNVNFPESAVQKATDDYVRDLYRSKEQSKTPKATPTPKVSDTVSFPNFILPSANAAEASFHLRSAKTETIKARMRGRVSEIISYKKQGLIGESNDGMLVIHDPSKVKPLLKKKLESFVKAENADRESLYGEIAESNHLSSSNVAQMRKSFTRSFQAESPSGTWVQASDSTWSQKR